MVRIQNGLVSVLFMVRPFFLDAPVMVSLSFTFWIRKVHSPTGTVSSRRFGRVFDNYGLRVRYLIEACLTKTLGVEKQIRFASSASIGVNPFRRHIRAKKHGIWEQAAVVIKY